jgi:hypothetical protein
MLPGRGRRPQPAAVPSDLAPPSNERRIEQAVNTASSYCFALGVALA